MNFENFPQKPHGGVLVDQVVPESERVAETERARALPSIRIDLEAAITIEMIATGVLSPLRGFMTQADYMTTPAHTRYAREIVGPGVLIAPEQRLVPNTDADEARATARRFLAGYLSLSNYRRTLETHGFTAVELDDGATDAAVDQLAPHGTPTQLAAVVQGQLDAGADHVCVQFLSPRTDPLPALEALAGELGLD